MVGVFASALSTINATAKDANRLDGRAFFISPPWYAITAFGADASRRQQVGARYGQSAHNLSLFIDGAAQRGRRNATLLKFNAAPWKHVAERCLRCILNQVGRRKK